VNFPIKGFPVENMRHPGKRIYKIEDTANNLPLPHEWIDEINIPSNWNSAIIHTIRILEVNRTILHIFTGEEK